MHMIGKTYSKKKTEGFKVMFIKEVVLFYNKSQSRLS